MPDSVSLDIDEILEKKIKAHYASLSEEPKNPYISFLAKGDGFSVSIFSKVHKNGMRKAVFQGEEVEKEASKWGKINIKPKEEKTARSYPFEEQIGSDEVGTGDFFGPICVVATHIDKEDLALLKELGVTDSKKIEDHRILEIAPRLLKLPYVSLSLDNKKYNEVHEKGLNMNAIKAKLHNKALGTLKAKYPNSEVDIDQFAERKRYFSYLKEEENICPIDNFATGGELLFPSVAAASCLARYNFIRKMEALSKLYGLEFPYGANDFVIEFGKKFLAKYGEEELKKVAKLNFATYKKILGE